MHGIKNGMHMHTQKLADASARLTSFSSQVDDDLNPELPPPPSATVECNGLQKRIVHICYKVFIEVITGACITL